MLALLFLHGHPPCIPPGPPPPGSLQSSPQLLCSSAPAGPGCLRSFRGQRVLSRSFFPSSFPPCLPPSLSNFYFYQVIHADRLSVVSIPPLDPCPQSLLMAAGGTLPQNMCEAPYHLPQPLLRTSPPLRAPPDPLLGISPCSPSHPWHS